MKKITGIILKILTGLVVAVIGMLLVLPVAFKGKIKTAIERSLNEQLNAKVTIGAYKLGLFRSFPDLTVSLNDLVLSGLDEFENDTLFSCRTFNLAFNLKSLFGKSGYEVRTIDINQAKINALVNINGKANWDIMKESEIPVEGKESASTLRILLQDILISNASVVYLDRESDIEAFLRSVNARVSGDFTAGVTNLKIKAKSGDLSLTMDKVKYLSKVIADVDVNLKADIDNMKFYLADNQLYLNDLLLNFEGMVAMPHDDIETDLSFNSGQSTLKSLMSLIPAVYMSDFNELTTDGDFSLKGSIRGIYSSADSTIPNVALSLNVNNGRINYSMLPEQIKNINIESDIYVDGTNMDKTTVDINKFHMELAGNPFDMTLSLKTPVSDPDFKTSMTGKIDLTALSRALPLEDMNLSGLIDIGVGLEGKMSMLEKKQYDRFRALGAMGIKNMSVIMSGYPGIRIDEAGLEISPARAILKDTRLNVGNNSDFKLAGRLENYLSYLLKGENIKGTLSLESKLLDLGEIMHDLGMDESETDTASLSIIRIPENIDFVFDARIDQFRYNKITANNVRGRISISDGILSMKQTGMDLLGGKLALDADYDTRDSLRPMVRAELSMESIGIKDAFNSFNSVRQLVPAAKGISGKVGMKLSYNSLLGSDFMPVLSSISGAGKLATDEVTLVESITFDKIKETLKLGDKYSNTFKDLNVSFKIDKGRLIVNPFNTRVGNVRMNVSGDQGLDQTINYVIKTEIPRSDLGNSVNSLVSSLSSQAASLGLAFQPSEVLKVNLKISGTFLKPIVAPFFGSSPSDSVNVASAVKETIKSAVDEKTVQVRESAREEAELQAERLMTEAEEKARMLREEAEKAAGKIRAEAEQQSQKILKEAESKGAIARIAAQKTAESIKKEADKRADQIVREADDKADKLVSEAKLKSEEILNRL